MQVTVSGRQLGRSEALKQYCQDKAEKLERFYNRLQSIEIILDGQAGVHTAEIIVHADRNQPFVAGERQEDAFAAIDMLIDKMERQLNRHKEKLRNRKHPPHTATEERGP